MKLRHVLVVLLVEAAIAWYCVIGVQVLAYADARFTQHCPGHHVGFMKNRGVYVICLALWPMGSLINVTPLDSWDCGTSDK